MTSPPYYFIVKKIDGKYVDRFTNPIHAISAAYDDAMWDGHKPDWYHFMYRTDPNEVIVVCMPRGAQKHLGDYIFPGGFQTLASISHTQLLIRIDYFISIDGKDGDRVPFNQFIKFTRGGTTQ